MVKLFGLPGSLARPSRETLSFRCFLKARETDYRPVSSCIIARNWRATEEARSTTAPAIRDQCTEALRRGLNFH